MFEIKIDKNKKAFVINVGGFFKPEEGKSFLDTYNKDVKSLNPSDYNVIILGEGLSTSSQEMIDILEGTINMYKKTGFKKYYGTLPNSPSATMQLKRVISKCGIDVEFGKNVDEILKTL